MGNDLYLICQSCKEKLWIAHDVSTFCVDEMESFIHFLKLGKYIFPNNRFIYFETLEKFYHQHKDKKFHVLRIVDPINDDVSMWEAYNDVEK